MAIDTLHGHLAALAQENPGKVALVTCDEKGVPVKTTKRTQLLEEVDAAASFLHERGLVRGERVAFDFDNSAEFLILSWAAWSMGVATVPLDRKRDTPELREFKINASEAKCTISQEDFVLGSPASTIAWMPGTQHEALILFTPGTTGNPKGARLSLENLIVNAQDIAQWLRVTPKDRFLVQLPLHHINSTTFCLSALLAGASIAIPPKYSHSHFWEQAANTGATFTSIVQSIVFDQLGRTAEYAAAKKNLKLNRIQIGSAPVVASTVQEFMQEFNIPLYQGYGQTETSLRVTGVPMDLPRQTYERLVAENSIGTPMKWAVVEVADALGAILGEGEEGEILVKGPAIMAGYLGEEPARTTDGVQSGVEAFRNGYFLTGDIGLWRSVDGRRFFFLMGRSKEIIIKGGVNISPVAVENSLKKISDDIEQTYAVAVADERYGEEVGATVVWKKDVDEIAAMRRLKVVLLLGHSTLSEYETPKYLATVKPETLPTTSTGKAQRTVLKKMFEGKFDSLYDLIQSPEYRFVFLHAHSPYFTASHALYNHCWQPLTKNKSEYKKYLDEYLTLSAIDNSGALAGQISFFCKDNTLTCVSICSATYKPKPVPEVPYTPSVEQVREYLLSGRDGVYNFHTKLGAKLVEIIPNGRPEDKSTLGYILHLSYTKTNIKKITSGTPVSNQLIEAVRVLGADFGASVHAMSRPGGLATYLSTLG